MFSKGTIYGCVYLESQRLRFSCVPSKINAFSKKLMLFQKSKELCLSYFREKM